METSLTQRQSLNDMVTVLSEGGKNPVVLSEQQQLALEWLMGGGSVTEAGQYAGVSRQSVSNWLHHDQAFRDVFQRWQLQIYSMNNARLIALSETALDVVADSIRNHRDAKVALVVLKGMGMLIAPK